MPSVRNRGEDATPPNPQLLFLHLPRTGGMALERHFEALVGSANVVRISLPPDVFEHLGELRSKQVVLGHFFYPAVRLVPGEPTVATVVREPVDRSISVWEYLQWQVQHPDHAVLASRGIRSVEEFAEDDRLAGHVRDNQTRLLGVDYDVEAVVAAFEAGEIDLEEAQRRAAEAERAPADAAMLDRAKDRLRRMVVGVTEELPDFVRVLERTLGRPEGPPLKPFNATPPATVALRERAYDDDIRRRLAELNRFDAKLYAFARELWESRRDAVTA